MRYVITGRAAVINDGVLELTKEQASPRLHHLKPIGEGRFEVLHPVEFKAGEEIGFDGELPKSMGRVMTPAKSRAKKAES